MCADITCSYFEFKAHLFKTVDAPREKIAADDRHRVSFRVRPAVNGPIQAGMSCPFAALKNRYHKPCLDYPNDADPSGLRISSGLLEPTGELAPQPKTAAQDSVQTSIPERTHGFPAERKNAR